MRRRPAFTLIELLVVIVIISIIAAVTLPAVVSAIQHRQVSETARLVQAAIEGARDIALRTGKPAGIRLLPDPTFPGSATDENVPLAFNRYVPIELPGEHTEGRVSIRAGATPAMPGMPALRVEECQFSPAGEANARTSWYWNARVGDRIRIGPGPHYYTICGPVVDANGDRFINVGPPGPPTTAGPWASATEPGSDVLFLVNGLDDDRDGLIDEGFNGIDEDNDGTTDEADEWETESWPDVQMSRGIAGAVGNLNLEYTIRRRPYPTPSGRAVELPSDVVIDVSTWSSTKERSRLPVDPLTMSVDLMVEVDGRVTLDTVHSSPAALDFPFVHLWLSERGDVIAPVTGATATARRLPVPEGTPGLPATETQFLKGERRILTINVKTGHVTVTDPQTFDPVEVSTPFWDAQRGGRDAL